MLFNFVHLHVCEKLTRINFISVPLCFNPDRTFIKYSARVYILFLKVEGGGYIPIYINACIYFNINVIVKCLAVKPAGYFNLTEMSFVSFILIYRYKQSDTWLAKNLLCLIYKFAWLMYLIYYKYLIFLNFSALTKLANSSDIVWFFCMCYSQFNLCNIQMCILDCYRNQTSKLKVWKPKWTWVAISMYRHTCKFYFQKHS